MKGQTILEKFESYQNSHHIEKVYISHDKTFYTPGDTIWCMAFFVDGKTHQIFENASPIIHIEWYDDLDSLEHSWMLKIDEGSSNFEIPLSYDILPGSYTLKAYTQYQRNFDDQYLFQKKIDIISDISQEEFLYVEATDHLKFKVSFYPEGGQIVANLKNRVAFKAQNEKGENIAIEGNLLNSSSKVLSSFKTYHEGIGFFDITPKAKENYTINVRYNEVEKSFKLPQIFDQGYVLTVDAKNKESIILQMNSNLTNGLKGSTLIGHVRGIPFLNQSLTDAKLQSLRISRTNIPSGVVHFTLFNDKGLPVCERISFNKNPQDESNLKIVTNSESFTKRATLELDINDEGLINSGGKYAITASNADLNPILPSAVTIENYLLFLSDLKGTINNPDQYFADNTSKTSFFLDLIMMTHGWRRFSWLDIVNDKLPSFDFGTQEDISLVGVVKKKNKDEGIKADVFVSTIGRDGFSSTNLTTDNNGVFFLKGFDFRDTMDIIIQAGKYDPNKDEKEKGIIKRSGNNNVRINLIELGKQDFDPSATITPSKVNGSERNELISNFLENRKLDSLYNPTWALEMDEFMVKSQRKTQRQKKVEHLKNKMKERGMFYFPNSQKIFLDDLPGGGFQYNNVFDIVRDRAPSVQVKGSGADRIFVVRGTTNLGGDIPALVLLDGMQISRAGDLFISPTNILAIDVVRGLSSASIFGEAGAGGVISIITKDPLDNENIAAPSESKGTLKIRHPGFYKGREFYVPNYEIKSIDHHKPDLRTTLFWKPNVSLNQTFQPLHFHVGDKPGNYIIQLEGVTGEGVPIVKRKAFTVIE